MMQIYLVGGAVRDKLLGEPVKERDWVVVGANPEDLLSQGYQQVGKDFPVFLHPQTKEEYALARTERKTAPGYSGFSVYAAPDVTLEDDLRRRDLSINAIAEAPDGTLIDPFNGQEDLQNGLLRHVSPAFVEDPVRILRIARFAARFGRWGFRVAHDTNTLMRNMVSNGEVDALVAERVWRELVRALGEKTPQRFFHVLNSCGALARIFPELAPVFAPSPEPVAEPVKETGSHGQTAPSNPALAALHATVDANLDTSARFAAMLSPLDLDAVRSLCERLRVPTEYRELAELLVRFPPHSIHADAASLLKVLESVDAFRRDARFQSFVEVCRVLAPDNATLLQTAYAKAVLLQAKPLLEQGFKGVAIKEELRRLRLQAIKALPLNLAS
jgi:tRNA nucleotidyltransferase (CCA-adding enzyme)